MHENVEVLVVRGIQRLRVLLPANHVLSQPGPRCGPSASTGEDVVEGELAGVQPGAHEVQHHALDALRRLRLAAGHDELDAALDACLGKESLSRFSQFDPGRQGRARRSGEFVISIL